MAVAVVGAGWSGAVIARQLAEAGRDVVVFEKRQHVAGNCHTERRRQVMVHAYGPHIFHTDDERVWAWVQRWGDWHPYRLTVRSTSRGQVFTLPVNLHTLNQVYQCSFTPTQAERHIRTWYIDDPQSFADAAVSAVSAPVFQRLFRGYTAKQWGVDPSELPASVFRRLPVRFNYDDRYFTHRHEAMPVDGYTAVVERILDHPLITLRRSTSFVPADSDQYDHTFWSGPLDAWFGHGLGRLRYRTLRFDWQVGKGDQQGVALMNWPDIDVPWTRVTEHNHLTPWESHDVSIRSFEHPADAGPNDEPFYPLRLVDDRRLLNRYVEQAAMTTGVTFVGRLGTYRYLDMDVTIREALEVADRYLDGDVLPFYVNP